MNGGTNTVHWKINLKLLMGNRIRYTVYSLSPLYVYNVYWYQERHKPLSETSIFVVCLCNRLERGLHRGPIVFTLPSFDWATDSISIKTTIKNDIKTTERRTNKPFENKRGSNVIYIYFIIFIVPFSNESKVSVWIMMR